MKVLYLTPQARIPGRLTRATFMDEEIRGLAAAGIQPFVLSTEVPADAQSGAVRITSIPARRSFRNRAKASALLVERFAGLPIPNWADPRHWYRCGWIEHVAAKVVQEEQIDLIHSHFAWPNGQGGMIVRALTGRPLIATLHGNDVLTSPAIAYGARHKPVFDRGVRILLENAERTVYFSQFMRKKAIELGAVPQTARVIRRGIDVNSFVVSPEQARVRQELGLAARPMVLTVAGLIPRKGIHHILEALHRLRSHQDFTFVVVGDGPERANLEALSAQLGLTTHVVFTGRVDRQTVPKYFAACNVFVLASLVEAQGIVLLEAMSAGRPVVCTESGGPPEFVQDGHTGFVVPVGDTEALAGRIKLLLQNPTMSEQFGAAGRRRAVAEFSSDRMISDLAEIYEGVLRERSSREPVAI
jgi:glycosyltransferase involved in cell wall biosynthesis